MRAERILVCALLVACGPKRRGELVDAPVVPDTAGEQRGARLFSRHCYECHPGGEAGLGPALNNKPLPMGAISLQIRKGVGAMPGFNDDVLTDTDVTAIAEYVIELRTSP